MVTGADNDSLLKLAPRTVIPKRDLGRAGHEARLAPARYTLIDLNTYSCLYRGSGLVSSARASALATLTRSALALRPSNGLGHQAGPRTYWLVLAESLCELAQCGK